MGWRWEDGGFVDFCGLVEGGCDREQRNCAVKRVEGKQNRGCSLKTCGQCEKGRKNEE